MFRCEHDIVDYDKVDIVIANLKLIETEDVLTVIEGYF